MKGFVNHQLQSKASKEFYPFFLLVLSRNFFHGIVQIIIQV